MTENEDAEDKSYPLFFVIGLAFGFPIGRALGDRVGATLGLVVGGGVGRAIDQAIRRRREGRDQEPHQASAQTDLSKK